MLFLFNMLSRKKYRKALILSFMVNIANLLIFKTKLYVLERINNKNK